MEVMDADVKLDQALHELGMLSTTTNIRKEFLKERNRTRSETSLQKYAQRCSSNMASAEKLNLASLNESLSTFRPFSEPLPLNTNISSSSYPSKGFQILQVNPQFVTAFSTDPVIPKYRPSLDLHPSASNNSYLSSLQVNSVESGSSSMVDCDMDDNVCAKQEALAKFSISLTDNTTPVLDPKAKSCFCQAYCSKARPSRVPRNSLSRSIRYARTRKPYDFPPHMNKCVPKAEKLECRSTSSSPMKGYNEYYGMMTRSRSLTNLEAARTKLVDIFEEPDHESAVEIENMSNRIEKLHFIERTEKS